MKLFQKGWNFLQDGPGNRLVYHMQGCNMRCPWCSNPEGMSKDGTLIVKTKHLLDSICPPGAIKNGTIDRSKCVSCKTRECITRNKTQGIMLSCFEMMPSEIAAEAEAARHLFHGGGGVTFTGGEPLLQFSELSKTLAFLKERGIHTAIETNAYERRLPDIFRLIDFLIIDLKHHDNSLHRAMVGVENRPVLENIKTAARNHSRVLVRITLVPGFNDSARDAAQFAHFFTPLKGCNFAVEFLKYHEYGKVKWKQCGLEYTMKSVIINNSAVEYFRNRCTGAGITIVNT